MVGKREGEQEEGNTREGDAGGTEKHKGVKECERRDEGKT